jgi:hypothetical protein
MATSADIQSSLAQQKEQLASQQQKLLGLQSQLGIVQKAYEDSAKLLAATPTTDPNYSRIQQQTQSYGQAYSTLLGQVNTQKEAISQTESAIAATATEAEKKEIDDAAQKKKTDTEVPDPRNPDSVYQRQIEALIKERQIAYEAGDTEKVAQIDAAIKAVTDSYKPDNVTPTPNNNTDNTDIDYSAFVKPVQESAIGPAAVDWRFRMSLAPSADYLYKATPPGILAPLIATDGVIFPYTPAITITYSSNYNSQDITHSNYKIYTYKNSAVEAITISADFTAQDSVEANYLLAVIHFFRSVTKMFYGQDQNPSRGIPPPLVYLRGFGQYQFDWHPVAITTFTHTFPQDVDFVEAYPTNNGLAAGALDLSPYEYERTRSGLYSNAQRLRSISRQIQSGGLPASPVFGSTQNINEATRVPSKLTIQLNCVPVVTRNAISNKFSLKEYATGRLMRGSVNPGTGGGIW